jgi:hypothetical protein
MSYVVGIYTIGLALMVQGLILSPECEKAEADTFGTLVAYLLWPVTVVLVIAIVLWQNTSPCVAKWQVGRSPRQ